jgi:hypothetical protein
MSDIKVMGREQQKQKLHPATAGHLHVPGMTSFTKLNRCRKCEPQPTAAMPLQKDPF